jgi:hypothetical protein
MRQKEYSVKGKSIKSISSILTKEFKPIFEKVSNTGKTFFYVFERYSFLQNSDMSGIILIDIINENECRIDSIVAGGKVGLLQLDLFGREQSILDGVEKELQKICKNNGWQMD